MLLEPSVNFSSPLLTITYTPAGLEYTLPPLLANLLLVIQALVSALALPLCSIIVVAWLHFRLASLESAPHAANIKKMAGVLHTTLPALAATQKGLQEGVDALRGDFEKMMRQLGADMNEMDADIATLTARLNVQLKMLGALEGNLEQARLLLGAGVDVSDDGLEMGDDVEVFWPQEMSEAEDDKGGEEEQKYIDIEASDELVWGWLEICEWPEECYDA
jgi:hypothetical protein